MGWRRGAAEEFIFDSGLSWGLGSSLKGVARQFGQHRQKSRNAAMSTHVEEALTVIIKLNPTLEILGPKPYTLNPKP